jgi:adenylosuccinate lyase
MIERYSLLPMKDLWTEEAKYERWLAVELAVLEAQSKLGQVPEGVHKDVQSNAKINLNRIAEIEADIKHDVLSFVRSLEEVVGESGRWLHLGLTASDVVDTANSLAMNQGLDFILKEVDTLLALIKQRAIEHKTTLMAGRTHGMHAEPVTFGLKLLNHYAQFERDHERLQQAQRMVAVGQCSGSVGTYANIDPEVERLACETLGLQPAKISSQVLQRDRYAQALTALAMLGASVERLVIEIRHLTRTEISEVFESGAHRSSSMPHKKNPITAETLTGLARILRANAQAELESITTWHERDIANSSVERIVLPDSFTLAHYMVVRTQKLVERLGVDAERMTQNLGITQGLVSSQAVLLTLVQKGMPRVEAHERIRDISMQVDVDSPLKDLLLNDDVIGNYLDADEIEHLFSPEYSLKHVDAVFKRFE